MRPIAHCLLALAVASAACTGSARAEGTVAAASPGIDAIFAVHPDPSPEFALAAPATGTQETRPAHAATPPPVRVSVIDASGGATPVTIAAPSPAPAVGSLGAVLRRLDEQIARMGDELDGKAAPSPPGRD